MILRYLLCLREGFERALLKPPHLPVIVTGGHHLIIVLGVETDAFHCLTIRLFREIEVRHHAIQKVLLMIMLGLFTIRFNPRVYEGFNVPVTMRVVRDQETQILRIGRKPQGNNVLVV